MADIYVGGPADGGSRRAFLLAVSFDTL